MSNRVPASSSSRHTNISSLGRYNIPPPFYSEFGPNVSNISSSKQSQNMPRMSSVSSLSTIRNQNNPINPIQFPVVPPGGYNIPSSPPSFLFETESQREFPQEKEREIKQQPSARPNSVNVPVSFLNKFRKFNMSPNQYQNLYSNSNISSRQSIFSAESKSSSVLSLNNNPDILSNAKNPEEEEIQHEINQPNLDQNIPQHQEEYPPSPLHIPHLPSPSLNSNAFRAPSPVFGNFQLDAYPSSRRSSRSNIRP